MSSSSVPPTAPLSNVTQSFSPQASEPTTEPVLALDWGTPARRFPARFGKYLVLGVLGEGGMGTVYDAEQERPHRRVALKTLRAEYAGGQTQWRFARESEALGRLQHPGIAQIYEAGAVDGPSGPQPYFAMELVVGRTLTAYAATLASDRDRLALVAAVCDAAHYAHQRGVIHRDLKPANILVDESGQPKILDFGVARLTDVDVQGTRATAAGEVVGTLQYMSPEQLMGDPLGIDVRCDVYALGVILYEMLAGSRPYELTGRQLLEAVHVVITEEPKRLGAVDRRLAGDVEVIVGKALEKDPDRRYQSAAALASDLRHHLNDEPITARPATATYQFRKFARRNRALVVGAGVAVAALVVGTVVSTDQAMRARAAERVADAQRAASEVSATRARAAAAKAQAVNDFLQQMLSSANPYIAAGRTLTVRDVLGDAVRRLDSGSLRKQPEVEAAVRTTLADSYLQFRELDSALVLYDSAAAALRRSVGPTSPALGVVYYGHGQTLRQKGDLEGAGRDYEQGIALVPAAKVTNDNSGTFVRLRMALSYIRYSQSRYPDAVAVGREALAIARRTSTDDTDSRILIADAANQVATILTFTDRPAEAVPIWEEGIGMLRKSLPTPHPLIAGAVMNYAIALSNTGRLTEAAVQAREALRQARILFAETPIEAASPLSRLGDILLAEDSLAAAEPVLRETLAIRQKALGDANLDVQYSRAALGKLLTKRGQWAEAETLLTLALDRRRAKIGDRHPAIANNMDDLADVALGRGDYVRAETLARGAADRWREAKMARRELGSVTREARAELALKHARAADSLLSDAIARQPATDTSLTLAAALELQADVATALDRPADTERSLRRAESLLGKQTGTGIARRRAAVIAKLVAYYEHAGRTADAATWRAKKP